MQNCNASYGGDSFKWATLVGLMAKGRDAARHASAESNLRTSDQLRLPDRLDGRIAAGCRSKSWPQGNTKIVRSAKSPDGVAPTAPQVRGVETEAR